MVLKTRIVGPSQTKCFSAGHSKRQIHNRKEVKEDVLFYFEWAAISGAIFSEFLNVLNTCDLI